MNSLKNKQVSMVRLGLTETLHHQQLLYIVLAIYIESCIFLNKFYLLLLIEHYTTSPVIRRPSIEGSISPSEISPVSIALLTFSKASP